MLLFPNQLVVILGRYIVFARRHNNTESFLIANNHILGRFPNMRFIPNGNTFMVFVNLLQFRFDLFLTNVALDTVLRSAEATCLLCQNDKDGQV